MTLPARFSVKAVGVSFRPGYPDTILDLARAYAELPTGARSEASLVRDRANAIDANAVGILAGGRFVGYIPAALAARLAPDIDAGTRYRVTDAEVLIHPEHPEHPGLLVRIERLTEIPRAQVGQGEGAP